MSEQAEGTSGEQKELTEASEPSETEKQAEISAPEPEHKNGNGKRRRIFMIGGVVLVIVAAVGIGYWLYQRQFESTDDAFVEGDITQVSPKVSAYISKIYVKNNQFVHKGDLLVDLDPKDLETRLEQAKAQLRTAQAQKGQAQANV